MIELICAEENPSRQTKNKTGPKRIKFELKIYDLGVTNTREEVIK